MKGKSDIKIELETISPLVADIPNAPVFTVPEGYFDQFPANLMLKIKDLEAEDPIAELKEISPLLAGLSRAMPMEVPDGYFEQLELPLEKNLTPVVSLRRSRFSSYAIAASIVAILGVGALLFNQVNHKDMPVNSENISAELPKISTGEMDEFLRSFPDPTATDPISASIAPLDIEDMMSDVDEQGLQEFLKDLPDVKTDKLN